MPKDLLVKWNKYENDFPVKRLVLYRGEKGGPLIPYRSFEDVTKTQFIDRDVRPQRAPYCYRLVAVAQGGRTSPFSNEACGTPRR